MIMDAAYWLGSEHSLRGINRAFLKLIEHPVDSHVMKMYEDDEDDERNPVTIDQVGSLAILNISGGMMNKSSWMTRFLGIPTYQDIRSQVARMAQDESVRGLMLNLDSPGGLADGCFGLCRFVRAVNDNVKPVVTFTDSKAHSAAYALMASGSKRVMSEDASVGSVGVIAVHEEATEMYKQIGIKHTVFRSAPFKALGQNVEKLTPEAQAEIQRDIMAMHNTFVTHIHNMTGLEKSFVNEEVANGRTFNSKEANRKKMVDNVMTLEETVGKLSTALEKQRPAKAAIPQSR